MQKYPMSYYKGPKRELLLIDTDRRSYGKWNLYETVGLMGKKQYYVELVLDRDAKEESA